MRLILLSILVFVAGAGGASAKYSFCNKSSYALSAAIGYVDGDRLATRGWWRLRPGQCKVVLTEQAKPGKYFVYAEAIPGHKGPLRTWSGDTALCVENNGFFNLRNQDVCRGDPMRQRKFFNVEVTEAAGGNWQTDFTEASTYTVYSAEVAGVQRLLSDIGIDAGAVDGAMGRETQRALANYRKEKGLPEGYNIDDELIDALIEDANAREAKLGFFYCNKTDNAVWSAIAEPEDEESYRSKGWWKIEPGDCAKIIKGSLEKDHYYVYGLIEAPAGDRSIAGGDKSFCVNIVMFNAANDLSCADQELEEAEFRRIEIGGAESVTFDFTPEMFAAPPPEAPAQTQ
ncbi:DUF1036 domain-containing protein [Hyphococcus luteus]|uniref:DUF1036 domain-containing protein n=1 Tax=Hyphococcus luteus TaxID=2058213 RepID=A0A2S7K6K9_9PROT|nr:DUF1036 domain-containing protein [Marinicaulis flavus]PQA88119.1 hypothetical protein CW354_07315 [Marinicaulis flavus]